MVRDRGDILNDNFKLIKQSIDKVATLTRFDVVELRKAIYPLAFHYGAAQVTIELPQRFGNKELHYLYGDENVDINAKQVVSYSGDPGAGGKTVITWISGADRRWNEDEIEEINFVCKTASLLSEKIRLGAMANEYYYIDTITGVNNINGLGRFAAQLSKRGKLDEYSFAFLNVIGFNYVNKKVGFKVGTKVLKTYACKLKELLSKDECISRPGGDNFVLVYKKENEDKILRITEGITVRTRINSSTIKFSLAARMGVYVVHNPDTPFENIMRYLSNCINYAKTYSRTNVVYYTKDVEHKVIEHKEFCQKFKNAIDKKEFFVVYQPKVFTKNKSLYGAEALVRWNNDGRVIYPGEFVEIFEKEHLIADLDFYVLERVCEDMKSWLENGIEPVKVSVNFSNDHLGDEELVERITEVVDRYGIDHSLIEIEMTETVDVNEINQLLSYVDGLHKNGFTVAIDDFGIGYSSLLMLQTISVDVLKIDKAFIAEVTGDPKKRENVILRHIINMAEDLGVEIVAEGVETDDQCENLTNMNCHRIQGYFFDKPLSCSDFSERLAARVYA